MQDWKKLRDTFFKSSSSLFATEISSRLQKGRQIQIPPKEVKLRNHSLAIGYFWASKWAKKFNQKAKK